MKRPQPVPAFRFFVTFYDVNGPGPLPPIAQGAVTLGIDVAKSTYVASFSEVSGLEAELEVEEYRQGGDNAAPLRFVKGGRFPSISFRRGVTFSPDLWDWSYQVIYGNKAPIRKSGVIVLLDRGSDLPDVDRMPVAVWHFKKGLPVRMRGPDLNANSNELAIESLEIAHEGLMRLGVAAIPGIGEVIAAFGV